MSTASQVQLLPEHAGVYHTPNISAASAKTASQVLQANHDKNHMFFNQAGFHNHISHHVLSLFALGATPAEIQMAFDDNNNYQRPHYPTNEKIVRDMSDGATFAKYLGQEEYFHDYVVFFEKEMDQKGWQAVVNEYVFSHSATAEDLLVRMFASFLHPLIHLGFGVEFAQPAIVAEALAQAAIHDNWPGNFLLGAEGEAASMSASKSLVQLVEETRLDDKVRVAARYSDGNKVCDGIFKRAAPEMTSIAAQWRVKSAELEEKTAEMINAAAYFTGGAQMPGKAVKFDFIYMHCLNASIFFSAFLDQAWIKAEDKARLLEWKGRLDLVMYASRGCPELRMNEITEYTAKTPGMGWEEIIKKVDAMKDDGHAPKLIRALKNGEVRCKKYEEARGDQAFPIRGSMWLQLARMAIDSVDIEGNWDDNSKWVRDAGFAEAWENIPDRAKL